MINLSSNESKNLMKPITSQSRSLERSVKSKILLIAISVLTLSSQFSQAAFVPQFSIPATNTVADASWEGDFLYPDGAFTSIAVEILRGAHIVPATNVSTSISFASPSNTVTVTMDPIAGISGSVQAELQGYAGVNLQTATVFNVVFLPLPAPVELALDFISPASTALPGTPFSGDVTFEPANTSVWFDVEIISGADIVPLSNITLTRTASNTVNVLMEPLTNRSGLVEVELTGEDMITSDTVPFSVFFKTYPPVIDPIAPVTMDEDTTNTLIITVSDVDTAIGDVSVTASMQATTNPNLFSSPTGVLEVTGTGTNRTLTIRPADDMNGVATIRITAEDDDDNIVHRDFVLTVTPVPDPSEILGATDQFFGDDVPITNIFAGVTIIDVDHEMPDPETLSLVVSLANDQIATFLNGGTTFSTSGPPAQVTSAIQSLGLTPIRFRGLPGTINSVGATISVTGLEDGLVTNRSIQVEIEVINTPPEFVFFLSPEEIAENQTRQPFFLSYVLDPDPGDELFQLDVELVNPADEDLVTMGPSTQFSDNESGLLAAVRGINVTVNPGILTNSTREVPIRFSITDGYGGTTSQTNSLQVIQAQTPPTITGIPIETVTMTDASPPILAFPTVFVQDPDEGGQQLVEAVIFQSNTNLGSFSETVLPQQTPQSLSAALQLITYTPNPGALPVGAQADSVFTLQVTDRTGLSVQNNNRRVRITSVNTAPQIANIPAVQPLLIPPVEPIRPFADLVVTNDDTNNVLFTITIDDPNKGTLSNLVDFVEVSPGVYQLSGSIATIMGSLPNIEYHLNPDFLFPSDDPGGTTFTLSARDFALLTTTRSLYIQIQDEPRNHLVTRAANDGAPGSLNYVLDQLGNNDTITFALPSYPATIRLPGSAATLIDRNVTIKGPGANLLTLSGDNNGDGIPNRQLFRIAARVTIEGVTLSHGTAGFGGAVLVQSNGNLTLRNVAVVDSIATQYGGAIDVDGGQLTMDGCFIGRNRLSADTGMSGAGISAYTDHEIRIVNTTFADNQQLNEAGDGGGAVAIQNLNSSSIINAPVIHSTFAENVDASGRASAVLGIGFGTRIRPWNSIFSDQSSRNVDVADAAEFRSQGGNVCDDSSRTALSQQGQSEAVFLLDHSTDLTNTLALLAPLNLSGDPTPFYPLLPGSPAINKSSASINRVDQSGILRVGVPDSGASEFDALGRVLISEIRFDNDAGVNFIELFVRRDSTPVDLTPYSLFVDGQRVHDFADSSSVRDDAVFTLGQSVSPIINPGFGMVVAFTNDGPITLTSPMNPTPVVGLSEPGAATDLPTRGLLTIGLGGSFEPIIHVSYNGTYLDPVSGTNVLNIMDNSIALAPQFRGFAFVPHSWIDVAGPFAGVDPSQSLAANPSSPGADVAGAPFGQENAEPLALPDLFTVGEDDLSMLDVLANDFDSDGNDRLVIVDISTASNPGAGDNSTGISELGAEIRVEPAGSPLRGEYIVYDPRNAPLLQQLPSGVEIIDTFYYEIIDIGSAPVEQYEDAGADTLITSINHRLTNNAVVIISGAVTAAYNGSHAVTVLDEDSFTIPVPFAGNAAPRGIWETAEPRSPSARSEASVSVRVIGANDPPVAVLDIITNVTERTTIRVMARPERAGDPALTFSADPIPPPELSTQDLLSNDFDIDTDDSWETLQIIGVLGALNEIDDYAGVPGDVPVTVHSPNHGLQTGTQILIANYGGHPSYNGYHVISVIDDDSFTIPVFYVDNDPNKGVWVILNESNRYSAVTDVGATVALTLRVDPTLDNIVYDANASSFLRGLAEDELYTNRFWYAIEDSHGAVGIGPIDVIVRGINDPPVPAPDPDSLGQLLPILDGTTNTLEAVLENGLDLMYTLAPTLGGAGTVNLHVLDEALVIPGTIVLNDFFYTDEDTPLDISVADLLANDMDIDRIDVLEIISVDAFSREQAALTLSGGVITYDPTVSSNLQALAREELIIDTFYVVVSDGGTDGQVSSLVAVLVEGVNDTPIAMPIDFSIPFEDEYTTNEDEIWTVTLDELVAREQAIEIDINQVQPDDRLRFVPDVSVTNPGLAQIDITATNISHDSTVSDLLDQLADWQSFTNIFEYTITDNSFLFATDDNFYLPAGATNRILPVLANDRDFTDAHGELTIIDAGPSWQGGSVEIAPDGQALIYSAPPGFIGDDFFRYTIENERGDQNSARVMVRSVVAPVNGLLWAADNVFTVAAGETVLLDVTANDNQLPATGAGLTITDVFSVSSGPQPILTNNMIQLTANTPTTVTFGYEVSAGGTARATAQVTVFVIERRGILRVQDDFFSVLPGMVDQELDVLSNDALITESTDNLRIQSVFAGDAVGTIEVSADARRLVYTPDPEYLGVEQIRYVATDQIGGTGTATVHIAVGELSAAPNFYKLEAAGTAPVLLDVLENNRTFPAPASTSLTIVAVSPASAAIGDLEISGGGERLSFEASGTLGQQEFTYTMEDASTPPRSVQGRVTIETVGPGTYANPNVFRVRSGGAGYVFDVLTNDFGYPNINREYSIIGLGAGADGPSAGGSVSIQNDRLVYTPAPGFVGEERFKYTMSDAFGTDIAEVTVNVQRGNLVANDDEYIVFYEVPAGTNVARSFTLPVTLNDRIQPALGQTIQLWALGEGTNAPDQGGSAIIGPDNLSIIYRPGTIPAPEYVERFTYEITDGQGRFSEGVVQVRVRNRAENLIALTQDDHFSVARNSTNNILPVLANDFVRPGSAMGWQITSADSNTFFGGTAAVQGGVIHYTPPLDFVGVDEFTYRVNDGLGGTGEATVFVRVGGLPTLPSYFTVLSDAEDEKLDVLANDVLEEAYDGEYTLIDVVDTSLGGSVSLSGQNTVLYTPDQAHVGTYPYVEDFTYLVADDSGALFTGTVHVVVHEAGSDRDTSTITLLVEGRNDPPVIINDALALAITDKQVASPFTEVTIIEIDEQMNEVVDVLVSLDDEAKGILRNLGPFEDLGGGQYGLTNVTGAQATAAIRELEFRPTENRITVPTTEDTIFTISVTDNKSPAVLNSNSVVSVTAVNDPPVISGPVADQPFYYAAGIRPFSLVTITEVDDLGLQPLDVTVIMLQTNGVLSALGDFQHLGGGLYQADGLTAEQATQQLRQMVFDVHPPVQTGMPVRTEFTLIVDDRFAIPVEDNTTSVIAYNGLEASLQPDDPNLRGSFGIAVDTIRDYSVVGAPGAFASAPFSGAAFIYRYESGSTNEWSKWQTLQPASLSTNDRFGSAVAMSDDLIAVSAYGGREDGVSVGAVYVFERNQGGSNEWEEIARITPTNLQANSEFGFSLALDGDHLAVGVPFARIDGSSTTNGAVYVFSRHEGGTNMWGQVMYWSPPFSSSQFGRAVSLKGDRLLVGAPRYAVSGEGQGAVWHFDRNTGGSGNWGEREQISVPDAISPSGFGWSISQNDEYIVIGAPDTAVTGTNNMGSVFVFTPASGTNDAVMILSLDEPQRGSRRYGRSVSIDGGYLFIGAPLREPEAPFSDAATYLYRQNALDPLVWDLLEQLERPQNSSASLFGAAVALRDGTGIVGAPATQPADTAGHAFMYRFRYDYGPVTTQSLPDQVAAVGEPFSYILPSALFEHPDEDAVLEITADFVDGANGLIFDAATETVEGTPLASGAYNILFAATDQWGGVAYATLRIWVTDDIPIGSTPREIWNYEQFSSAVTNAALEATLWGGSADPDGDGLSNDQEYAFGTDPNDSDAAILEITQLRDGVAEIVYVRRSNDPSLIFSLEKTDNLIDWIGYDAAIIAATYQAIDATREYVILNVTADLQERALHFRIRVHF